MALRDKLQSFSTKLDQRGKKEKSSFLQKDDQFLTVEIDLIEPDPNQPREFFDAETLQELAQSIADHGVLQPITVRENKNKFLIVAGERRWRAAKEAGLAQMPVIVRALREHENPLVVSLIENLQRENLKPLEEARAYQRLIDEFKYTHETAAQQMRKDRTVITKTLSLLKLPPQIQQEATQLKTPKEPLIEVAKQKTKEEQLTLWNQIKNQKLTVRQVRKQTEAGRGKKPEPFVYNFSQPTYQVRVKFKKSKVETEEIITALKNAILGLQKAKK